MSVFDSFSLSQLLIQHSKLFTQWVVKYWVLVSMMYIQCSWEWQLKCILIVLPGALKLLVDHGMFGVSRLKVSVLEFYIKPYLRGELLIKKHILLFHVPLMYKTGQAMGFVTYSMHLDAYVQKNTILKAVYRILVPVSVCRICLLIFEILKLKTPQV